MIAIPLSSIQNRRTLTLCLAGAVLGLLEWGSFISLMDSDLQQEHIWISLLLGMGIFGVAAMSLLMHLPLSKSLAAALGLAVGGVVLSLQGLGGYADVDSFLLAPQMGVALSLLSSITLPFIAVMVERRRDWRNYRRLFEVSWSMVCSWAVAMLFCGLAWGVLMASHVLLSFVGITFLADVLLEPAVAAVVSGALVGAGLAISSESDGYLSPLIFLKLLRLLTPVLLVVMVVFIVALPWRTGEGLPLAAICVAAVLGASTLVSAVVADEDANASATPLLRASARLLGVVMPVVAAVALWAVVARVAQYGWTPARVSAMTGALVAAAYGLNYFRAVCHTQDWMARVRRSNIWMAIALIVLAVLWLSRILSPESLSVTSQVERFKSGELAAADFPEVEMRFRWGLPGQEALRSLVEQGLLDVELEEEESGPPSPDQTSEVWEFSEAQAKQILLETMPSSPANHPLLKPFIEQYPGWDIAYLARSCLSKTPAGHPDCLLVFADLLPSVPGDEAIILASDTMVNGVTFAMAEDGNWKRATAFNPGLIEEKMATVIDGIHAHGAVIQPAPFNVLKLPGGAILGVTESP
ncbi:MAG TPA: hypothetical protein DEO64_00605 [Alcaligenes faecalis]|nr:hypothetical protein [Alcaligenes faecalis]